MGYEIWDRDACALVADFDDLNGALDFLREMLRPMNVADATKAVDPLQLVRVTDEGRKTEVVHHGVDLLNLIFASPVAH